MKVLPLNTFLLAVPILLFLLSCSKTDDSPEQEISSSFLVGTNISDPLFLTHNGETGEKIEVYGTRDSEGNPLDINSISVYDQSGLETIFIIDSEGRPEKIFAANGTQFELDWVSNFEIGLTVFLNDGENQINTSINLIEEENSQVIKSATNPMVRNGTLSLKIKEEVPEAIYKNHEKLQVLVTKCNEPINNRSPFVTIQSTSVGNYNRKFPLTLMGNGTYSLNVPSNIAGTIEISKICSSLASKLDKVCTVTQLGAGGTALGTAMCGQLALAANLLTPVTAATVFAACESITAALSIYCATFGGSPAPGAPSVAEKICASEAINYTYTEDILIKALVVSLPNNIYSPTVYEGSQEGPFPNFTIDLGSMPEIQGLVVQPSLPGAGQDYKATARLSCLPANSMVTIQVTGTDGFEDSITRIITSVAINEDLVLTVPGAETGVKDIIEVTVVLPLGNVIKRTASLVFN